MLAKLTFEDGSEAILEDNMTWEHEDEDVSAELNLFFTDHQPGDHHAPPGSMAALRASNYYGADLDYGSPPFDGDGDVIASGSITSNRKTGNNCGIGAGGFTKGNKCASGGGGTKTPDPTKKLLESTTASNKERAASMAIAQAKIDSVPVPDKARVKKMRDAIAYVNDWNTKAKKMRDQGKTPEQIKAKLGSPPRAGGDARGSSTDRRKRAKKLFREFGGEEKGYVVCPWTGLKMHWADPEDKKNNPEGYPKFEQGKIFTAYQGGGYQMPNLLPESFVANRSRNDKPIRKENLK